MIHFIMGPKGGVGKSFFALTLINYLKNSVYLIDTDKSNPDVYKASMSDGKSKLLDSIALDMSSLSGNGDFITYVSEHLDADIVVNGRASNDDALDEYFDMIIESSDILEKPITLWWVINDQKDSVILLKKFLDKYSEYAINLHVVLNKFFGNPDDFEYINSKLSAIVKNRNGHEIVMTELPIGIRNQLYNNRMLFSEIQKDGIVADKIIVNRFMRDISDQLVKVILS